MRTASPPEIAVPPKANHFVSSTIKPRTDVTNASGVMRRMEHVDHMQIPDRQDG
jgi:hypothetical protein